MSQPQQQNRRCFKCQKFGHNTRDCPNEFKCRHCGFPHDSRGCPAADYIVRPSY